MQRTGMACGARAGSGDGGRKGRLRVLAGLRHGKRALSFEKGGLQGRLVLAVTGSRGVRVRRGGHARTAKAGIA